ncbi:hypothetical protein BDY24DRAFT_398340 [Mrakia frigida]|uniref:uncharacterized protein n=1 Tax=Mrakia frigida TaxID=29902 RepID=UPI003FCC11DB
MDLQPFSLSKIIPVELINLIIQESSDSNSTLRAWCLVSLGTLSAAGPRLNQHVQIAHQDDLVRVLQKITLDKTDPLVQFLPRLSSSLSLKNVKRLSVVTDLSPSLLESIAQAAPSPQPKRTDLELEFVWTPSPETKEFVFSSFIAPTLVRLLRPGAFWERISTEFHTPPIRSWALQCYYNVLLILPPIPASEVPNLDPEGNLLGHCFAAVQSFVECRQSMRGLLRPRGLGAQHELELELARWSEKVEALEVEQARELERRMDEGCAGSSLGLREANQRSQDQLEEIGVFLDELNGGEDDESEY